MDSLTEHFNRQAYDDIFMIPVWIMLLEDIAAKRARKRFKRILKLDREFNAKAMKQSRNRYRRQVAKRCAPRPYRLPAPRF